LWPQSPEYWQEACGQKEVIDPYSSRKSWYFLGMGSGLIGGLALHLYLNQSNMFELNTQWLIILAITSN